jgi:carboxylesterase
MRVDWFSGEEHQSFTYQGGDRPALLLHGFMGTPAEMRPLGRLLSETGFDSFGPLLPGFGEDIASLNSVTRADWMNAARETWSDPRFSKPGNVLIGFSMGGAIALQLAHESPPDRLILMAPLWKLLGGDWKVNLLPVVKRFVSTLKPFGRADFNDPDIRDFFAGAMPELDLDDQEVRQVIRNEIEISTSTLDELRRMAAEAGAMSTEITIPTLVIQGTDDTSVRSIHTRKLVERMGRNAQLVELPADHMLVSETSPAWQNVRELISEFLETDH